MIEPPAQIDHPDLPYDIDTWDQEVRIDPDGNAAHRIVFELTNTRGPDLLELSGLRIEGDACCKTPGQADVWAETAGGQPLECSLGEWDDRQKCGSVTIRLKNKIPRGRTRKLVWGYHIGNCFFARDEWFVWTVQTSQHLARGCIKAERPWTITYAEWDADSLTIPAPPLDWKKNRIKWEGRFLHKESGILKLLFGLEKSAAAPASGVAGSAGGAGGAGGDHSDAKNAPAGTKLAGVPGTVKLDVCGRLIHDWRHLADYFKIPAKDRAAFEQGDEPRRVWEWLEQRDREVVDLAAALRYIKRGDVADLLSD